jgi:hypothetical protein
MRCTAAGRVDALYLGRGSIKRVRWDNYTRSGYSHRSANEHAVVHRLHPIASQETRNTHRMTRDGELWTKGWDYVVWERGEKEQPRLLVIIYKGIVSSVVTGKETGPWSTFLYCFIEGPFLSLSFYIDFGIPRMWIHITFMFQAVDKSVTKRSTGPGDGKVPMTTLVCLLDLPGPVAFRLWL